jgi:hypothetical protein
MTVETPSKKGRESKVRPMSYIGGDPSPDLDLGPMKALGKQGSTRREEIVRSDCPRGLGHYAE